MNFKDILEKLEAFVRRYYFNELIKGSILFFSIGLLYFLATLLVEHFLWLNRIGRTILFWIFVIIELALFVKFIVTPLTKLFKLQKGINHEEASKIIGNHFSKINDKLLNVLQLNQSDKQSELLLASIEQKSSELNPIPFKLAINFKNNLKYLKYAAIPVVILLLSFAISGFSWFSDSYNRVVHYQTAYEPPAPFQFFVVNEDLKAIENKDFILKVKTAGNVLPENAQITFNNETYFLQQKGIGEFEYVFSQPKSNITFQLSANEVSSKPYTLQVLEVPTLLSFEMALDYPTYTKKKDETLKSTGNAVVPQGTIITWKLDTKATESVYLYAKDTMSFSHDNSGEFVSSKNVNNNFDYTLNISNTNLKNYESLSFSIRVIKDEFPELKLKTETDSLDHQTLYFYGQVSDDYGLSKLRLVYYPTENEADKHYENIHIGSSNFDEFISAFPDNLNLTEGTSYELYFQVFDNDALNNYKSTKSKLFTYRKLTKEEEEQNQLQEQSETIQDLNKSLKKFEEQDKQLEEFSKTQKEKPELNFNDKKKLESFLKRQQQQEEMMQNFNKRLKENLEDFQKENIKEDQFKEDLKERLKQNEEQLKQDEKLLEELKELQDKINKEELNQKLEQLAKQNKNKKRSLEQLLELTKRYYVGKKLEKLQQELEKLAIDQDKLSEESEENNSKEKQEELNKKFEEFKSELSKLQKENNALKKPMDVPRNEKEEKEVDEMQENATESLEKKEKAQDEQEKQQNQKQAKQKQKQAAQKMKQMSQKMHSAMQMSGGEQMGEDTEMLRQILDNLVVFSFDQEALMEQFKSIEVNHSKYASYLRKQSNLREHFEHIDDSLFALSLRQPKLSETVNKEIIEAFFNIDKSLEQLAENRLYQGVANQQYTITSANNLANFLSNVLDNLQEQMNPSPGQGGDGDMQLPDIIMSQEELNKQMEDGLKKGEKEGKQNEGEEGKEGEKDGKEKGDGKQGQQGNQQGEGEGSNEDLNGELYRIYQQQQQIRQALEDRLSKEGLKGSGSNLLKKMEEIEMELLNKGFTQQTLQKMMELQHQLLKMENATFQQGKDNKRKSETNKEEFNNSTKSKIPTAKQYFNTTEILNRQALPLRQVYKRKVQEYFKQADD